MSKNVKTFIAVFLILLLAACGSESNRGGDPSASPSGQAESVPTAEPTPSPTPVPVTQPDGMTVGTRFGTPAGFRRIDVEAGSFAEYLRNLPLKPDGSPVMLFDGTVRADAPAAAVIDLDIGTRDLQRGSHAMIRLRGEYLYAAGLQDKISFNFLSGFACNYAKWALGYRVDVDGKNVKWVKKTDPKDDYDTFINYLNTVYVYTNTTALELQLEKAETQEIGNVYISTKTGSIMIVDICEDADSGERLMLLAQERSPAESIHVLENSGSDYGPWYPADFGETLVTPEAEHSKEQLKRFPDFSE